MPRRLKRFRILVMVIGLVAAILVGLLFYKSFQNHARLPGVPKTWDDEQLADLTIPLASPDHSPTLITSSSYYWIPVRRIYKTYPVYHPDHEPEGYLDQLKTREPVGERRAIPRLEQLHGEHPDYTFAAIALAQFAAGDGEFQRARDLLAPCFKMTQLHTSEATALFAAQAQIALEENDIDAAERAFDMLSEIADEDDPQIMAVRYRIDRASSKKGLRGLFSWR